MEFRRSGQSNQRRRRVLKDDPTAAADEGAADGSTRRHRTNLRQYSDHALAENQLRVTDLIPQRPWTYLVLLLGGLLVIALVQTLFLHHSIGERIVGRNNLSALDPARSGSIAGWVSSMLLGLAAMNGVVVFSLRRHKIDDYRGRYRIWLPITGLLLLASLDASTGLHRAGRGLVDIVAQRWGAGASIGAHPHFWWVSFCLFGVTLVGVRLAIEMRSSRAATTKLAMAYGCYVVLALVEWQILTPGIADLTVVATSVARLVGDLCLCLAATTYARYVYLDAQGIIAARRVAREKKRRQAQAEKLARKEAAAAKRLASVQESKSAVANSADADSEHSADQGGRTSTAGNNKSEQTPASAAKPAGQRPTAPADAQRAAAPAAAAAKPGPLAGRGSLPPASADADDDDDDDDGDDNSQLSRAERRRLRKLQRRETRKAA